MAEALGAVVDPVCRTTQAAGGAVGGLAFDGFIHQRLGFIRTTRRDDHGVRDAAHGDVGCVRVDERRPQLACRVEPAGCEQGRAGADLAEMGFENFGYAPALRRAMVRREVFRG